MIELERDAVSTKTLPDDISRNLLAAASVGRRSRICRFNDNIDVDAGVDIVRTRSGIDVVNRITKSTGLLEDGSPIVAVGS